MKTAEIRELSTKELRERVAAEVASYNQTSQIKLQRKLIARMKTELRQRELNNK